MVKKILIIFAMTGSHFAACKFIIPLTVSHAMASAESNQAATLLVRFLVGATRVLFFPIISLSLYSRQWFPGDLIYVPIFINSVLWGTTIYFSAILIGKLFKRI